MAEKTTKKVSVTSQVMKDLIEWDRAVVPTRFEKQYQLKINDLVIATRDSTKILCSVGYEDGRMVLSRVQQKKD